MAGVVLNVRPALAVTCNTASIQAIAPSSSTITSAAETALGTLPYCLIDASINTDPALGDVIHYELDLPDLAFWNSRLLFAGNSALAGVIPVHSSYLADDYAVVGTDTGHALDSVDTNNAAWALNNPPAVLDFEYGAVHQVAVAAKVITGAYYGKSIGSYNAYFDGCSTGGRQSTG